MKSNTKKIIIAEAFVILLGLGIFLTFAFFTTGDKQKLANTFSSGCLSITIDSETSAIDLKDAVPVTDVEGLKEDNGYSFTIKNNCSKESTYAIYLDKLESTLEANYVKVSLSSDTMDNLITKLSDNSSEVTNEGAVSSYNLFNGTIGSEETKEFTLKEWIDYDTTVEEGANKTFSSKINVAGDSRVTPISNVDIKFTKSLLTLIGTVPEGSSNIKYCTTTGNVCTPNKTIDITDNKITINLEEKEIDQIVCTSINEGKIICSNPVNGKYCPSGSSACETIIANRIVQKGEDSFSDIDDQEHKNESGKSNLYTAEDDFGDSMYFRGNVDDNWLVFGKDTTNNQYIWWRIIRINGNGTIRLIYAGTNDSTTEAPDTTGETTMIKPKQSTGDSTYKRAVKFNAKYDDNKYVGYMYPGEKGTSSTDFDGAHKVDSTSTKSDALIQIELWYNNDTSLSTLADKIDVETGFCSDTTPSTTNHGSNYPGTGSNLGYGSTATVYGAEKIWQSGSDSWNTTEQKPTLKCTTPTRDLYTGPNATGITKGSNGTNVEGNNALPVPVGLITADEVLYAGGFGGQANSGYWLYTNQFYWTMSPYNMHINGNAYVFRVNSDGTLIGINVDGPIHGVRPVINLKADIKLIGSGTSTNPYKVEYDNAKDKILADNSIKGTPTFTGPSCSNCTVAENGIYTGEDDFGTSYVYRGTVDNNWVKFGSGTNGEIGDMWWRIIRINGNGTIRLIYAGTTSGTPSTTGETTMINPRTNTGNSSNNRAVYFNQNSNDNKYVGYMYNTVLPTTTHDEAHRVTSSSEKSTILEEIEYWYNTNTNLKSLATDYIDVETGFCSDTAIDKSALTSYQGDGYGNQQTAYAPWGRLYNESWKKIQTPALKCGYKSDGSLDITAQKRDLYTGPEATAGGTNGVGGKVEGNNVLPIPVGLITNDEVVYAGGFGGQPNSGFWLNTNQYYWTMSPYNTPGACIFMIYNNGVLGQAGVSNTYYGIRPVINIKSNVKLSGSGTSTDPYIVET